MKILWISPRKILPAIDGAKVATAQLLGSLSTMSNLEIDVLCISRDDIGPSDYENFFPNSNIRNLYFHRLPERKKRTHWVQQILKLILNPLIPLTYLPFTSDGLKKTLLRILRSQSYDYVVWDGLHGAMPFLQSPTLRSECAEARFVYRAHNLESELWRRSAATAHFLLKPFFIWQFCLVDRVEKLALKYSSVFAAISPIDAQQMERRFHFSGQVLITPSSFILGPTRPRKPTEHPSFLFLGRLDWPPNRDGLTWFLDNVWVPLTQAADFKSELWVVGSGDASWLSNYRDLKGLNIMGFVENTAPVYEQVHATIIPIFVGSGTRIKAIDAIEKRVPIISTKLGVEGLPIDTSDYTEVCDAQSWQKAIVEFNLKKSQQISNDLFEKSKSYFDPHIIARNFIESLERST